MKLFRTFWLAVALTGATTAFEAKAAEYGAIAYSQSTEAYGFSHNYQNRAQAERRAMNACRQRAGDCRIAVWFYDSCAALAVGNGDGWGAAFGQPKSRAERDAIGYCRQYTTGCRLELSFCSW